MSNDDTSDTAAIERGLVELYDSLYGVKIPSIRPDDVNAALKWMKALRAKHEQTELHHPKCDRRGENCHLCARRKDHSSGEDVSVNS